MCRRMAYLCLPIIMLFLITSCIESKDPAQETRQNEVFVSLLTPEGSEIITDIVDLLILDNAQPFSDLIHFYKTILFELGVEETGHNDKREGIWIFSGVYEGSKPITIEIRDSDDSVRIYIIY